MRNDLVGNRSLVRVGLLQKIDHFSDARKYKRKTSHQVSVTHTGRSTKLLQYNILHKRQSHF